ncbi:MAG: hypothetical protein PHG05_03155 [Candidatus Nanoarchaeia archaeon]|nr:hypothetical protein [Candidatus Nanoarchaeia archaeon]
MKCEICKEKIQETFLEKIKGTFFKKKAICSNCQRKYTKEEILEKI